MTKIVFFYGLRRSGNHGILNLIIKEYPNYVHINDTILSFDKYENNKNIDITLRNSDNKYVGFKECDLLIISMENQIPDFNEINKFNEIEDIHIFILLRNPVNNLESAWTIYNDKKKVNEIRDLWITYSKIFINDCKDYNDSNKKINYIIYEKFYNNEQYRIDIFQNLNIKYNDVKKFLNESPGHAKSSFKNDKKNYGKNKSIDLKIKLYNDNANFKKLITNELKENWKIIVKKFNC